MNTDKPTIEVSIVKSTDNPVWQLLVNQQNQLDGPVKFFKPDQLQELRFRTFFVAQLERCIVGVSSVRNSSVYHENALGVGYISTHTQYQNLGVATAMVKALLMHAQLQGKAIVNSPYELEGQIYLQPVMQRIANKFATVEFVERDYSMG